MISFDIIILLNLYHFEVRGSSRWVLLTFIILRLPLGDIHIWLALVFYLLEDSLLIFLFFLWKHFHNQLNILLFLLLSQIIIEVDLYILNYSLPNQCETRFILIIYYFIDWFFIISNYFHEQVRDSRFELFLLRSLFFVYWWIHIT
jgi:hypothetical protein